MTESPWSIPPDQAASGVHEDLCHLKPAIFWVRDYFDGRHLIARVFLSVVFFFSVVFFCLSSSTELNTHLGRRKNRRQLRRLPSGRAYAEAL